MLVRVYDLTVFFSLLFIDMYCMYMFIDRHAGFSFCASGFPVIECKTPNSASVLNLFRLTINLASDGVEQTAVF